MILHLLWYPTRKRNISHAGTIITINDRLVTFSSFYEDTNLSPTRWIMFVIHLVGSRYGEIFFPRLALYKDRAKYPNYDLVEKNSGDCRPYHGSPSKCMHDCALTFSLKLSSRGQNLASDSKPCFSNKLENVTIANCKLTLKRNVPFFKEILTLKVMRSRNFHSMNFPQIWYKHSFSVPDVHFNKKRGGHRVRLVTMVTRISWFI